MLSPVNKKIKKSIKITNQKAINLKFVIYFLALLV